MKSSKLANTTTEITRIQEEAPPVITEVLLGDTRLTGRWNNKPFASYLPGMKDHVLVAKFQGEGDASLKIGGKILSAPSLPGTITLAPRGHDGWWRVEGKVEVSNIYLGHQRLQVCADQFAHGREPELLDRINFDDPKLFAIMKLLSDEADSGEFVSRLFMEPLVDLVCLQLLRSHSEFPPPTVSAPRFGLAPWQLRRVIEYMRENLDQDIGLQELADLVGLSRFHFCTVFRQSTGYPPHEWLSRQRIEIARKMLTDSSLRIIDIALAVGYQTPSAFAASFRKIIGVTPTEFRRGL